MPKGQTPSAGEDSLPPFSMLTSDEDRERKAEASSPGTYHVVVNPDSFSNLPEYADGPAAGVSVRSPKGSQRAKSERADITSDGTDPNVVILKRFEDATRRSTSNGRSSRQSTASDTTSNHSPTPRSTSTTPHYAPPCIKFDDEYFPAIIEPCETHSHDNSLLENFRNVVWKQLIPVEYGGGHPTGVEMNGLGAEFFEHEAAHFPPVRQSSMLLYQQQVGVSMWLSD